jgi:hypothetical protein
VALMYSSLFILFFSPVLFSGYLLAPGEGFIYYLPNFYAERSLWDPLVWGGFPVAADPQPMTWYPLAILFSFFQDSWNGFVLSAYVLSSCFTYGYVYSMTRSCFASALSGTVFGMSGFMMAHLGHTSMVHTAAWMPLVLWTLEELRHKFSVRWFVLSAFAIGCSSLAGHPQIFLYTIGLSAAQVFILGWRSAKGRLRYYGVFLASILLGEGLAAVQLLPAAELANYGLRAQLSFAEFISYSLPSYQTIALVLPYIFGGS